MSADGQGGHASLRDYLRTGSVDLQAVRLDRAFPARDFLDHVFREIFGTAPLGRHANYADIIEPCLDRRRRVARAQQWTRLPLRSLSTPQNIVGPSPHPPRWSSVSERRGLGGGV